MVGGGRGDDEEQKDILEEEGGKNENKIGLMKTRRVGLEKEVKEGKDVNYNDDEIILLVVMVMMMMC